MGRDTTQQTHRRDIASDGEGMASGRETPGADSSPEHDTARLQALAAAPFGEPCAILPNLYLVRVPLPHNPLKALNSYIVTAEDKTTIVDVGFDHPACEEALDAALTKLDRPWDSVEIVLTHSHPDHTGNLDRIWHEGMPLFANLHSFQEVENLQEMEARVYGPLLMKAATPEQREDLSFEGGEPRLHVSAELLPLRNQPSVTFLEEGDVYRAGDYTFEVIETPGHDPWHICLYDRENRLMIVGDHVLERITPSISTWFPSYNALGAFLSSLDKVYDYDVDLVLPGHGKPFHGLRERVGYLIKHHEGRLREIYDLVSSGHDDIVSLSSHAKWRYDNWCGWPLDQKFFSMGETMAHAIYLVEEGEIRQTICGGDYRFELP